MTAIFVRTTLLYYISTKPARRAAQTRNNLQPLAHARALIELDSAPERERTMSLRRQGNSEVVVRTRRQLRSFWIRLKSLWKVSNEHGVGYRPWGLVNFAALIAFSESIRLKCGARDGLLPLVLSPLEWLRGTINPDPSISSIPKITRDPAEILAERIEAARDRQAAVLKQPELYKSDGMDAVHQSRLSDLETLSKDVNPGRIPDTAGPYFDATMQTEGLPWATNLTFPDPTFVLPVTLAIAMLNAAGVLRWQRKPWTIFQRLSILFTPLFMLVSVKFPAAILLYFIPSILAGWLQSRWLNFRNPILPAIAPCKRPIRLKVRRDL